MGYNARLNPMSVESATFASIATNSSSYVPLFAAERAGQVLGAIFWNGTTSSVASGTTAASAMNVYVYKTASNTDSIVASAALAQVATLGTQALTLSTNTALTRFAAGGLLLGEVQGGAGNNRNNAGAKIVLRYMYAYAADDDATP